MAAVDFQLRTNSELLQILDIYNGTSIMETEYIFDFWDDRVKYKTIESIQDNHIIQTDELLPPPPHNYSLTEGYLQAVLYRDFLKYALTDPKALDLLESGVI